jgi:LCP family protein required for cell wall assembly
VLAVAVLVIGGPVAIWRWHAARQLAAQMLGQGLALMVRQPGTASVAPRQAQDPITVLVMGTEDTPQFNGQQTDSMMVWAFDPGSRKASVVSVPRDIWIDIPGYGQQRINSAYEFGGYPTAELAVEKYIGVPIEYYAVVDYAALVKLVNDVGGIDVNNPYNIHDTCFPNAQENRCTTFVLSAGEHHLDGQQALDFARERHSLPLSDISREANQQLVLFALKDALLQPRNLLNLPTIMGDMESLVKTNLPIADLPALALQVLHMPTGSITHAVLDYQNGAVSNYTTGGGADVLLLHAAAAHRVITGAFGPELAKMGAATVQVENGAPTSQPLATYFTGVLDGMGVRTLPAEQAAQTDLTRNEVIWNTAAPGGGGRPPAEADMLAEMLDTQLVAQAVPASRAQIVVLLGSQFPKVQP